MTKGTGDDGDNRRDKASKIDGVDPNVDTKILTPEQDAYKTNKVSDPNPQPPDPFSSTATVGDYRIIRRIGEGGMGVVYEAEQQNPRRLVALKVIRGGLHADDYHVKMFEREIQALARLKHPGIASIYESGRSEDGQIFFAMELVRGTSLTEFVSDAKISGTEQMSNVNTQLELFSKICDVVSYAHQRGVIHRDLKPQNILVTDETEESGSMDSVSGRIGVKILDFGLARITDPDIAGDASDLSQVGQIKGTLLYMSPEQVRGRPDDIDVRSDVYSLGVMLYEMLTGQMPYDLSQVSLPEAMRIICEETPKMPSKVWSAGARRSGKIDTDVETIILKALEKEPDRRYQSVAAMMDDIQRYLTNQPITARPPSPYYQFQKLVARHKAAFASMATIFLLLLGFGVVMAAQSVRIANERDKAEQARADAEEQRLKAEGSRNEALTARNEALVARNEETKQRKIAEDNLDRAESEQKRAEEEKAKAETAQKAEANQRRIAEQNVVTAQTEKLRAEDQTKIAQTQTILANEQKILADTRKTEAETQAEANRELLYVSQINLAQRAWQESNITRMDELLENQFPKPGQKDLRGYEWYYLWRLSHRELMSLYLNAAVEDAAFSPDGTKLFVRSTESELLGRSFKRQYKIAMIDTATGKETDAITGHRIVALSSDRKKAIFPVDQHMDSKVHILDMETKQITATSIRSGYGTTLSSDGSMMAQLVQDGTVELWNIGTEKNVVSLEGNDNSGYGPPMFSPNSKILAAAREKGNQQKFWDAVTGKELAVLTGNDREFFMLAFSPDAGTFVTGSLQGRLKLWDLQTKLELAVLKNPEDDISSHLGALQFSPDGKTLAAGIGRTVHLYDVGTKQALTPIKVHGNQISSISFSPDNKKLAAAGNNWERAPNGGEIQVWDIPFGEDFTTLKTEIQASLSPDGRILATIGNEGAIKLWEFSKLTGLNNTRTEINTVSGPHSNSSPRLLNASNGPTYTQFSPDGKILALIRNSPSFRGIEVWNLQTNELILTIPETVRSYAFKHERQELVTFHADGLVRIWELLSGKLLSSFQAQGVTGGRLRRGALSPGAKSLVLESYADGATVISVIDTANGNIRFPPLKFDGTINLSFGPDGCVLAIWNVHEMKLIDISTGVSIGSLPRNISSLSEFTVVAFSSDGASFAFGTSSLELWNVAEQKGIGFLKGIGPNTMLFTTFSPDGRRIVTQGTDRKIIVWDVATRSVLLTLPARDSCTVTFSPDGRTLFTSMLFDGPTGIQIWRGATDEEVAKQRGK